MGQWSEENKQYHRELREKKQLILENKKPRNEVVKEIIIKACRQYLQENKYQWTEEQSQTTSSYYFHIIGDKIMDWQAPCIRISDHKSTRGKYRLAEFILNDIGKHTKKEQIKKRVVKELKKGFHRLNLSARFKALEHI